MKTKTAQRLNDTSKTFKKISAKEVAKALGGEEVQWPINLYVVGFENQFTATGYEYFGIEKDGKTLIGYHNPYAAKTFTSLTGAKKFISDFIAFENVKILDQVEQCQKFVKWITEGCVYRHLPAKNKSISRKYNGESKKEVLKWWIAFARSVDFEIDQDDYESWPELYSIFKHIHSVDGYTDGKISFTFFIPKSGKFKDFKKEFELVSPYCTCTDGISKIYRIFDHFLSEGGNSVSLHDHGGGAFSVKSSFSTQVSGTLEICFDYLKRERWYGD